MAAGEPHWSKDFVEHLRTVHFALITVSVGLILLIGSSLYRPANAVAQFEHLTDACNGWDLDSRLAKLSGMQALAGTWKPVIDIFLPNQKIVLLVEFNRFWTATDIGLSSQYYRYANYVSRFTGDDIRQLKTWWTDHSNDMKFLVPQMTLGFGDVTYKTRHGDEVLLSHADLVPEGSNPQADFKRSPNGTISLSLMAKGMGTSQSQWLIGGSYASNDIGTISVSFPIKMKEVVIRKTDIADVPESCRSFEDCFPDLTKASAGLESLKLADVREHLIQELEKGDSVFEAFGLKIPSAQLTFWGSIAVLSVQLYFFLHLKELHTKIQPRDSGWDVPWLGMYSSWLSRVVFAVTVSALPLGAVGLLSYRALPPHLLAVAQWRGLGSQWVALSKIVLFILAVCISALLCWLCWKHRPLAAKDAADVGISTTDTSKADSENSA